MSSLKCLLIHFQDQEIHRLIETEQQTASRKHLLARVHFRQNKHPELEQLGASLGWSKPQALQGSAVSKDHGADKDSVLQQSRDRLKQSINQAQSRVITALLSMTGAAQ